MSSHSNASIGLQSFENYCCEILKFLAAKLPFSLWIVTRTDGADWTLQSQVEYPTDRTDLAWLETFCMQKVAAQGACLVTEAMKADGVGAYLVVPLYGFDTHLIGHLCAINAEPIEARWEEELDSIKNIAALLAAKYETSREAPTFDARTILNESQLYNFTFDEDARAKKNGITLGAIAISMAFIEDSYFLQAATRLTEYLPAGAKIARIAQDELLVSVPVANPADLASKVQKLGVDLNAWGVVHSLGHAMRAERGGMKEAIRAATAAMRSARLGRRKSS